MKRREFLGALGMAAGWSLSARAQQTPVVGFLGGETPEVFADRVRAFRQGLSEAGFVEGRNVIIAFQWAGGNYDLLRTLADELVRRQVAVIVSAGTTPAALAAKAATATIPVVFYAGGDPVTSGVVASLSRPGGNVTGVTSLNLELLPKRLELLRAVIPRATSVAGLFNPTNRFASAIELKSLQDTARTLGLELHVLQAANEREFEAAFATLSELRVGGLVVSSDASLQARSEQLGALAALHRIPAVSFSRDFVTAGGLMSYGGNRADMFRLVGLYTGRILKGEKPADLPVMQVAKIELIINLKIAKALGLEIPAQLLARADEVIE